MKTILRRILSQTASLDTPIETLSDDDDLYAAGLTSLATVRVMVAIEEEFGIEIPGRLMTHSLFQSIDLLATTVAQLAPAQRPAAQRPAS